MCDTDGVCLGRGMQPARKRTGLDFGQYTPIRNGGGVTRHSQPVGIVAAPHAHDAVLVLLSAGVYGITILH
jgi:hypothetical protein